MNADRRIAGKVVIELLNEGSINGEISDQAHAVIGETLAHMQKQEYHQLRAQEKFEGKNASTDKQIAICRVALPALETALHAYNSDDFQECITGVKLAIETDGTVPKPKRKGRRRA
ncbi:hypothetical protein SEA_CAPTAINREX_56 [Microbacterium phage CaptainRex]|nr:hypothetical protein SEA_QUADZERO_56 [Microbacterium phage QuadZero]QZD99184.1 hypothetical protein SEA_HASITHA_56 [Microbacterium phage Hasitha]UVK59213.1 hypothetical protein SEA_LIBRIE_56 [Microbacterium phage Librie]WIC89886.1 hypothetical protein SEA_CAPTAINREX_56 [Microbacterium phage CaptainRex]